MKIKIQNLGPIHEFEIDLSKNFTMLFGKNNIGKSCATSVVYLIVKSFLKEKNIHKTISSLFHKSTLDISDQIDCIQNLIENSDDKKKNIAEPVQNIIKQIINVFLLEDIQASFYATFEEFENLNNRFSDEKANITITTGLIELSVNVKDDFFVINHFSLLRSVNFIYSKGKKEQNVLTDDGESLSLFKRDNANTVSAVYDLAAKIMDRIYKEITDISDNIYYFPASRSGLYQSLNSYSPIFAELARNRAFLNKKFEIPSIPEPVIDYFLTLSNIKKRKSSGNCSFVEIVKEIEESILQGEIIFDDNTKKILFKPYNTNLELDMFQTSSMVSEIAPLVSFIKYIIAFSNKKNKSKSLLFIEEPEAHLHPEIQVKLMAIFAKLTKNDIKIILTTHSNYMFNKINNLILDKQIVISDICAMVFEYSDKGSTARKIPTDDFGIDDENFLDVTENLFNEKLELIDKMNRINHD